MSLTVDVEWWRIFKGRTLYPTLVLVHVQSLYCMGMMIQIYQDKLHNLPKLAWLISAPAEAGLSSQFSEKQHAPFLASFVILLVAVIFPGK